MDAAAVSDQQKRDVIKSVFGRLSSHLDNDSRFGLFAYSDGAIELIPLGRIEDRILSMMSLDNPGSTLNYEIKNPVAALEKVIYSLRSNERVGIPQIILVLSDGDIETGNPVRDQELSNWLLQGLSDEMKRSEIALYWLAFNESADFRIIQSVTRKTDGAYFRTFTARDAVTSVNSIIDEISRIENGTSVGDRARTAIAAVFSNSMFGKGITLLVLIAAVSMTVSMVMARVRRRAQKRDKLTNQNSIKENSTQAILRDLAGFTALKEYDITDKKTYIGRLPREVTERSTVVVIRDGTVGREHATIIERDGAYWLEDNGTVNGTYLNNQKLNAEARLHNGDKIRFARFEFEIDLPLEENSLEHEGDVDDVTQISGHVFDDDYYEEDEEKTVYRNH
jgi:hypothetical protein